MRAFWWLLLSLLIINVANNLSYRAAENNIDLQSPTFGVGLVLTLLIWTLVFAQTLYTRVNRVLGYLALNGGVAVCLFLASVTLGLFLNARYVESGYRIPGIIGLFGGILVAAMWLSRSIVTLVRGQHSLTRSWRILASHRIVQADSALQH